MAEPVGVKKNGEESVKNDRRNNDQLPAKLEKRCLASMGMLTKFESNWEDHYGIWAMQKIIAI